MQISVVQLDNAVLAASTLALQIVTFCDTLLPVFSTYIFEHLDDVSC